MQKGSETDVLSVEGCGIEYDLRSIGGGASLDDATDTNCAASQTHGNICNAEHTGLHSNRDFTIGSSFIHFLR